MPSTSQIYPADVSGDTLQLLLKDFSSLNRAIDVNSVLEKSLEIIQKVMRAEASSLMLLDEDADELVISLPSGPVKHEIQGERIGRDSSIGGWVLHHEESYFTNSPHSTGIFGGDLTHNFKTRNIICSPLFDKNGKVIGVLQAINRKDEEPFSEEDIPIMEALAQHVATAIERCREFEQLQSSLEQKEILLTEISHRIKNNLLTLSSLIEMEMPEADKASEQVLKNACARLNSMAEIHDILYHNEFDKEINLGEYLSRLAQKISSLLEKPSQNITVEVNAKPIGLDAERTMCCGLLLNELLVNAYKHAFKDEVSDGKIIVGLTKDKGKIYLEVADNGVGLREDTSMKYRQGTDTSDSIGGWLLDVLLRRLEASMKVDCERGTCFEVQFDY